MTFNKENNKEGLKFKVGDHVRTSKYKNTFCKRLCSKFEFFMIRKWKEQSKTILELKKVIKRKDNKLYMNQKGYDSSFKNWIDKKDITLTTEYFPKRKFSGGIVKVELDLFNYADLKQI